MSGMNTGNSVLLTRQEIWSRDLKEALQDELAATKYVDMIVDFPDGETFTIPSIGNPQVDDYVEDTAVTYRPLDTGEWQFTIDEYIQSATHISNKAMQDAFYAQQLMAGFVPKQHRAIMEHFETSILTKPEAIYSANGQGVINGYAHRMAGANSGQIELADFAYANLALTKANAPSTNRIAIVDPSVAFIFETLSNLTSVSNNPRWEGIVSDSISTGMSFVKSVYGFDVYTSNYLPDVTDSALPERDQSTTNNYSSVAGKANYFFSADADVTPWKAAWRQTPTVESEYNKDYQRTEVVTTARYGAKLYRPENMVTIVSKPAVS